jgi:hypothetical protein
MNNVAMNMHVQVECLHRHTFISTGYIPRSALAGSSGNCIFEHLRKCQVPPQQLHEAFEVGKPLEDLPTVSQQLHHFTFPLTLFKDSNSLP